MGRLVGRSIFVVFLTLFFLVVAGGTGPVFAQIGSCIMIDDGTGTATLPPIGCTYISTQEVYQIIDGLPPGDTIELTPIHQDFVCRELSCGLPGGGLGGEVEDFDSILVLRVQGTGSLSDFTSLIVIPLASQTHTGPRTPGDPVQDFPMDLFNQAGSLPPGDPDFAQLQLVAGTSFGLPSPGNTTLTDLGDGSFHVDSFFDVTYQISFQGAPGSILDGLAGTTVGTIRLESVGQRHPCLVPDDGTGTAELPPPDCEYTSPGAVHLIIDGLPPGTEIELSPRYRGFFCPSGVCGVPGGNLGGEVESYSSELVWQAEGTGSLAGFRRTLRLPISMQTHSGPRIPGEPIQSFPTDVFSLLGVLPPGDPDFASLEITSGTGNGLPSPGHTSLTNQGDGTFLVDSFFDITYQIDFVGAPGGALDGLSGSTVGQTTVQALEDRTDTVEPNDGTGMVTLPPETGAFDNPEDLFMIIDGLPPGTTIEIDTRHWLFFCDTVPCGQPGGTLGGDIESFQSTLALELNGTGSLTGFTRTIQVPVQVETHSGPNLPPLNLLHGKGVPTAASQIFDADLHFLQGSIVGDPDFDQLLITAGTGNALPSPGHTTVTDLGDGTFMVDSFFDITYQIDFVGAPGGALDGLSGSTQGTARVSVRDEPAAPAHNVTIALEQNIGPTDFLFSGDLGPFTLNSNGSPDPPRWLAFYNLSPGIHSVIETLPVDWLLVNIHCDDPDGGTAIDLVAGQALIDLDLGESIICTYKNSLISDFVFADGFETGNVTAWSSAVGEVP